MIINRCTGILKAFDLAAALCSLSFSQYSRLPSVSIITTFESVCRNRPLAIICDVTARYHAHTAPIQQAPCEKSDHVTRKIESPESFEEPH